MCITKLYKHLFAKVQNIRSRNQLTKNQEDELILSPREIDESESSMYIVNELKRAIYLKDVYNIALSGIYGSGKSSVIKTLIKQTPSIEFLEISLASLSCKDKSKENEDEDNENDLNKIEYSILKQIFYKESAAKLTQSRFGKLKHVSRWDIIKTTLIILLLTCCLVILLEPDFLKVNLLTKSFALNANKRALVDVVCLIMTILITTCYIIPKIIVKLWNFKLVKLKLPQSEIQTIETESVFNKYLEEIIYFFVATNYNVVVFEDIDRFDNIDIFIKLKDLNRLLNQSKTVNKEVVFIYALKDDIFSGAEHRTKFFDKIVTTIPYIDTNNAADRLYKLINPDGEQNEVVEKSVCYSLGSFISDMRILKNIVSEFNQYKNLVCRRKDCNCVTKEENGKLLGIVVYKNYFPEDFAKLGKGEDSRLLSNFNNLNDMIKKAEGDNISKIDELKSQLKKLDNIKIQNIKELRSLYLRHYELDNGYGYYINGKTVPFDEIISSDDLFDYVINNKILQYNYRYSERKFGVKFSAIENKVDPNHSYAERAKLCDVNARWSIEEKIKTIEEQIRLDKNLSMSELLSVYPQIEIESPDDKHNKLCRYLLSSGLIDKSYYLYTSYFYPGKVTENDMEFIKDVLSKSAANYEYKLEEPKGVVSHFEKTGYIGDNMLNFSLLNYLYEIRLESDLFTNLNIFIKEKANYLFVIKYYKSDDYKKDVLAEVLKNWSVYNFVSVGLVDNTISDNKSALLHIALRFNKVSNYSKPDATERDYIENNYSIVAEEYAKNHKIENYVIEWQIIFNKIDLSDSNFTKIVVGNNLYKINNHNIRAILETEELKVSYEKAPYTTILNSDNKPLIEYIEENIAVFINNTLDLTGTEESVETIKVVINNSSIEDELKITYIQKQSEKITSLVGINAEYHKMILDNNLITPNWKIFSDYSSDVNDDTLHKYVKQYFNMLGECKNEYVDDDLLIVFIDNIDLSEREMIELMINILTNREFNQEVIDHMLIKLGGEYAKIPNRRRLAKLQETAENSFIIDKLWSNKYIHISSEPKPKNGFIEISTKRTAVTPL